IAQRNRTLSAKDPPNSHRLDAVCVATSARYSRKATPVSNAISHSENVKRRRTVGSSKCQWTVCFGKKLLMSPCGGGVLQRYERDGRSQRARWCLRAERDRAY